MYFTADYITQLLIAGHIIDITFMESILLQVEIDLGEEVKVFFLSQGLSQQDYCTTMPHKYYSLVQ